MSKYIPYLILTALVTLVILGGIKGCNDMNSLKDNLQRSQDSISKLEKDIAVSNKKTDSITKKYLDSEKKIAEVEKTEQDYKNTAAKYKELYKKLSLEKPITTSDSLKNCKKIVDVVIEENVALEGAVQACDSIKGIQYSVITDLKEIVSEKDKIIENKDKIITQMDGQIVRLKKELTVGKKIKPFLGGVGVGALLVLLLI